MTMMRVDSFSKQQLKVLSWWCRESVYRNKAASICDGAVRSGKTVCRSISFFAWSVYRFANSDFALWGKTFRSLRRNMVTPIIPVLKSLGFECSEQI